MEHEERYTTLANSNIVLNDNRLFQQYWSNGNLRYEWYYDKIIKANGKIVWRRADGMSKGWYENGILKQTQMWKNHRRNGLYEQWFPNGQKKRQYSFIDNKREGKHIEWWDNGAPKREGRYFNNKKHGLWTWRSNGDLQFIQIYKNGVCVDKRKPKKS